MIDAVGSNQRKLAGKQADNWTYIECNFPVFGSSVLGWSLKTFRRIPVKKKSFPLANLPLQRPARTHAGLQSKHAHAVRFKTGVKASLFVLVLTCEAVFLALVAFSRSSHASVFFLKVSLHVQHACAQSFVGM